VQIEEPQLVIDAIRQWSKRPALKVAALACAKSKADRPNYTKAAWRFLVRSRRIG
jgi:hypothetical protein